MYLKKKTMKFLKVIKMCQIFDNIMLILSANLSHKYDFIPQSSSRLERFIFNTFGAKIVNFWLYATFMMARAHLARTISTESRKTT